MKREQIEKSLLVSHIQVEEIQQRKTKNRKSNLNYQDVEASQFLLSQPDAALSRPLGFRKQAGRPENCTLSCFYKTGVMETWDGVFILDA